MWLPHSKFVPFPSRGLLLSRFMHPLQCDVLWLSLTKFYSFSCGLLRPSLSWRMAERTTVGKYSYAAFATIPNPGCSTGILVRTCTGYHKYLTSSKFSFGFKAVLWIRIRIGSGFIGVPGSVSGSGFTENAGSVSVSGSGFIESVFKSLVSSRYSHYFISNRIRIH